MNSLSTENALRSEGKFGEKLFFHLDGGSIEGRTPILGDVTAFHLAAFFVRGVAEE
jgi:hypothetical protein